jgi:hypothetical protein
MQESPFTPSLFGETLEDVMAAQKTGDLPRILTFLTEKVLELNGAKTEGIFR